VNHLARAGWIALVVALGGCGRGGEAGRVELVISAATSLSDVLGEAAALYQTHHPDVRVLENFGGSGALEQQIRQGAGADLFISAGTREMDALERSGLIRSDTRRVLAGNALALAVPVGRAVGVHDFAGLGSAHRVAMGAPASVPAGAYALASLRAQGLWARVEPKVVYTNDVRQSLAYVERGEVDAALVYRTDALRSRRARIAALAPAETHPPIVYTAAVTSASRNAAAAARFLDFLASPEVAAVFHRYGFLPPPGEGA
jgi:molybdate transport system substrate-binding protein